jgi:alkylhydroperoxidase/carboxymuconolactone decarboxylase family protein YurZ
VVSREEIRDIEELRKKMTAHELPMFRWAELFYEHDPGMYTAYVDWTTRAREHIELDPKIREFIAVAIDCVVMWPSPYLDVHMNKAFDAGATVQELADVVLATGRLMGPHSYTHGFNALEKVVNDRDAKGYRTPKRRSDLKEEKGD